MASSVPILKRALGLALCAAVLLSGCSSTSDGPQGLTRLPGDSVSGSPGAGGSSASQEAAPTLLGASYSDPMLKGVPAALRIKPGPLDGYLVPLQDHVALTYALQVLIASCMHDRGFQYDVGRYTDFLAAETDSRELADSRMFGLANLAQARVYGFGEPSVAPYPVDSDLSDAAMAALLGPLREDVPASKAGCRSVAADRLSGSGMGHVVFDESRAVYLRNQAALEAAATEPYQAVLREWADCLRTAGYVVTDPARPALSPSWKAVIHRHEAGTPAAPAERKLAVADIKCQVEVDLVQRLSRIVNRHEADLLEQNSTALQEEQEIIKNAVAAALKIAPAS